MPINLRAEEEIEKIKSFHPDLILVFSYGHILPQEMIDIPKWGCLNLHASLLPKWRGPSPVQYSLLNNEKETGFSIMVINSKIDEGKILYKEALGIHESDNTGLSIAYQVSGAALQIKTASGTVSGSCTYLISA